MGMLSRRENEKWEIQRRKSHLEKQSALVCLIQVTIPGEVVDVACGVDHMVSMVKSFM